jgi:hypothetical protein
MRRVSRRAKVLARAMVARVEVQARHLLNPRISSVGVRGGSEWADLW